MTAPKPLLPCPERIYSYKILDSVPTMFGIMNPAYADWWQDVARRAMELLHAANPPYHINEAKQWYAERDELRAAISKAIEGAK